MTDQSELYRLMCDTPEIQKHEWKEGDWRYHSAGTAVYGGKAIHRANDIGVVLCTSYADIKLNVVCNDTFLPDIRWFLEHIEVDFSLSFAGKCHGEINNTAFNNDSAEIVLFEIFMFTSHGKTWNDERKEWVKE